MKVLHITATDSGGAGKACIRLHNALLKLNNVESKVLVFDKKSQNASVISAKDDTTYFTFIRRIRYIIDTYRVKGFAKKINYSFEGFAFPSNYFSIHSHPLIAWADIVHLHWAASIIDYKKFFNSVKKPIFWTLHDMSPFSPGYSYLEDNPYRNMETSLMKMINKKEKAVQNSNISIVALSTWLLQLSKNSKVFKNKKHFQIFNCVNTNHFKVLDKIVVRKHFGFNNTDRIVMFIADNLNQKRKGLQLLMNAINQLDNSYSMICVGKNQMKETDRIKNLGEVKNEKYLNEIYNLADVLVVPSLEDNLPNTVVESLCAGTPVIAFNVGGMPDLIVKREYGILITELNSDALLLSIKRFFTESEFVNRDAISSENHKRFSENEIAHKMFSAYSQIIA